MRRLSSRDYLGCSALNHAAVSGRPTAEAKACFSTLHGIWLEMSPTQRRSVFGQRGLESLNEALTSGDFSEALDILAMSPLSASAISELNESISSYQDWAEGASDAEHERSLYNTHGMGSRKSASDVLRSLETRIARLEARRR
jgi:hypothetical protein